MRFYFFVTFLFLISLNLYSSDFSSLDSSFKKISNINVSNVSKKDSFYNDEMIVRRSGGRSGRRSFSSRRSRSSSKSYGSKRGFSKRRSTTGYNHSTGYNRGGGFYYFGGGSSGGSGISGLFVLLIIAGIIIAIIVVVSKRRKNDSNEDEDSYSCIKLQFGLHSTAEDFRKDIIDLASMDYDSESSMKELVSTFSRQLKQNKDYIKYVDVVQSDKTSDIDKAERDFDTFIEAEKEKYSQITFSNDGGRISQRELSKDMQPGFMDIKEYFVVTLIISYAGNRIGLEDAFSWEYYEKLLTSISVINSNNIVATELLWSPDANEDVLNEDDIIMYYPELKSL